MPGQTMHHIKIVERDYTQLYKRFISLGDKVKLNGLGAHGNKYHCDDVYEDILKSNHFTNENIDGNEYPSLKEAKSAANVILQLSSLTNGELARRAYQNAEKKTGMQLTDLAEGNTAVRINFEDLKSKPHRYLSSPVWSYLFMMAGLIQLIHTM
ncbi:MAG: hypothetical protein U5L09_20610 [Bacteroidales bacterium]|nr:hypothetical protein [Bacteroidales bacterium]